MRTITMMSVVASAMLAMVAHGGDRLWLGGPGGVITVDLQSGALIPGNDWIGGVDAFARNNNELLIAFESPKLESPGSGPLAETWIRREDLTIWPIRNVDMFPIDGDVRAMVVAEGELIVGLADGRVRNLNPQTGAVLRTRFVDGAVATLHVHGSDLFIGADSTMIYRTGITSGAMNVLTACGGVPSSMAFSNGELLVGTSSAANPAGSANIYRIEPGNGAYYGVTPIAFGAAAMTVHNGSLLLTDSQGVVRRVDQTTGKVIETVADWNPLLEGVRGSIIASPEVGCVADFNRDGTLGPVDFLEMLTAYRIGDIRADVNFDMDFSAQDFLAMLTAYCAGCR